MNSSSDITRLTKCGYMDAGRCGGPNIASHVGLVAQRVIGFETGGSQLFKRGEAIGKLVGGNWVRGLR